ncbi:MAG TPA: hypothetical protein VF776_00340 [Sphingomicrobium sp.]
MTRLMIMLASGAAVVGGFGFLPTPAAAQQNTSEITVFGNDPCPRSTNTEIYVCNRRPESERYRLPKNQQLQGTRQQRQSWAKKAHDLTTVGNTGVGSCSAVGPGGREGCLVQEINQAKQESKEQQQSSQPPQQ